MSLLLYEADNVESRLRDTPAPPFTSNPASLMPENHPTLSDNFSDKKILALAVTVVEPYISKHTWLGYLVLVRIVFFSIISYLLRERGTTVKFERQRGLTLITPGNILVCVSDVHKAFAIRFCQLKIPKV